MEDGHAKALEMLELELTKKAKPLILQLQSVEKAKWSEVVGHGTFTVAPLRRYAFQIRIGC